VQSISKALVAALADIENPPLAGRANYGKYALLVDCLKVSRKALSPHGLALTQMVSTDAEGDKLVTRIVHVSGEYIQDDGTPLLCDNKSNPQKMGSAITYARRYGLCSILGIVGEQDDDGQAATPASELPKKSVQKPTANKSSKPVQTLSEAQNRIEWASWVNNHIEGFKKHKNISEHTAWSTFTKKDRAICAEENPEALDALEKAYITRKNELLNHRKQEG